MTESNGQTTTENTGLAIDAEVEAVLVATTSDLPPEEGTLDELVAGLKSDEARWLQGIGRAFLRYQQEDAQLTAQLAAVAVEVSVARERVAERARWLTLQLEDATRAHRKAGLGNTLTIAGVGVWNTRKAGARWQIDNARVLGTLSADERREYTYEEPPKPPERKLKGDEFRANLDGLLREQLEGEYATAEERANPDAIAGAGTAVAEDFPEGAVAYVPETINVSYDLNV